MARALDRLGVDPSVPLVVGVSGGADSMALLSGLHRWMGLAGGTGRIVVAHLNHQLRGSESDLDEALVREEAQRLGLPCEVERRDVATVAIERRLNLEAVARECRYEFLARVAARWSSLPSSVESVVVCTAHTADDQAETVLMRLLRGSGATGLAGIHHQRRLADGMRLIRPLLDVKRSEVIEHCQQRQIDFRTDQSNHSTDYLRNRVRHELIGILESYNPAVSAHLVRTAELLRDDDDCLQELTHQHRSAVMVDGGLAVDRLRLLPVALRRRMIRDWVTARRGGPHSLKSSHLDAVETLLAPDRSGRKVGLPGHLVVVRVFDQLRFQEVIAPTGEVGLEPGRQVEFGGLQISLHSGPTSPDPSAETGGWAVAVQNVTSPPGLHTGLRIRARRTGDSLQPAGTRHRIKLKKLMIRHKIPVWRRDTWPVIVSAIDDRLVWVPGVGVSAEFVRSGDDPGSEISGSGVFWLEAVESAK